jgi:uncharacterized protein DUF5670
MKQALYIISLVFLVGWIFSFFLSSMGAVIHVLLFISAITAMQGLMICPKRKMKTSSTVTADPESALCI